MDRRHFLSSIGVALAGSAALLVTAGGCVAPRVSPSVTGQKAQAWRCENCGHLTRSDGDLTDTRCPRCFRKGFMKKITEKELEDYLK
jgi:DNA-directed RNA polymerase subunit RPC12/RpoP